MGYYNELSMDDPNEDFRYEPRASPTRKPGPFASLRDIRYTACPCGCGAKEICDAHRASVKTHNDAIPF